MMANIIGRKTIRVIDKAVNLIVLIAIMLIIGFAGYALWDSEQINHKADKTHYEIYKPTPENEGKTFWELQVINSEVIAWLSVYGTNIDYPVTQAADNRKYVNTDAEGQYSLSGAIFLDYHNSPDFSDFNSILYGHHMDKKTMFGEIGDFKNREMFDSHRYGNLYFDGQDHGIEFFAFIHTSAYDDGVFRAGVPQDTQQAYLDNLLDKAVYTRDIAVTTADRIILLTTCSSASTNGRDILAGRITDKTYADSFINTQINDVREPSAAPDITLEQISLLNLMLILLLIVLVLVILYKKRSVEK